MIKVTINDRVELTSYQLKDVAHIWFTRYDLPSSYAFQIKPPRKAYPRNANAHNANVVPTVPNHKWKENRGTDAVPITWECFRYDLPSSYAFQIKPPGKAYPRNANTHNAAAWAQDFVRMNEPEFLGSQVGEDPRTSLTSSSFGPRLRSYESTRISRVAGWRGAQNLIDEDKPRHKAYLRNAYGHNAYAVLPVPDNKVPEHTQLVQCVLRTIQILHFLAILIVCWYDLPSSYAFQIKPRRIDYPRNTNAHNAYTVHPIPNHKVWNVEFRHTIQLLVQSVTNQNNK
ncbi:hypothetical protein MTR67_039563 [Solanum verrucosum]|uniref:Uncharacterized protein n=1 Tax=Solanum verrucosum TaxID=315347 RepID=A0AAF0UH43_SOLVR|nr:hypothetical protein MTR67_039563 [Solanum verrucosum]